EIIALWEYKLNIILGGLYSCLNENMKSIEAYKKADSYDKIDNFVIYSELVRLNKIEGNFSESDKYFKKFTSSSLSRDSLSIDELYFIVGDFIEKKEYGKAIEYLLPLSEKTIDQICKKAFFSFNDNNIDKGFHEYLLQTIFLINNGNLYNSKLFSNAIIISNLYKRRLEYYADINLGIQKLKINGYEDAIKLQKLEDKYNTNPSMLLEEDIAQLKTKLISSGIMNFDWLCNTNFNEVYESIKKNELVINIMSYHTQVTKKDYFAVNFNVQGLSLTTSDIPLQAHFKLFEKDSINSSFFDYIQNEIFKNDRFNSD